jgi:hypothetical protein
MAGGVASSEYESSSSRLVITGHDWSVQELHNYPGSFTYLQRRITRIKEYQHSYFLIYKFSVIVERQSDTVSNPFYMKVFLKLCLHLIYSNG